MPAHMTKNTLRALIQPCASVSNPLPPLVRVLLTFESEGANFAELLRHQPSGVLRAW